MNPYFYTLVIVISIVSCSKPVNIKMAGPVFGTTYSIQYYSEDGQDLQHSIDSLFYVVNKSMSTYQTNSDISKLNRNEANTVDAHFIKVFKASKEIYTETEGSFDPTIGNLVNAWDFGPEGNVRNLDSLKIDSLMLSVGLNKVHLEGNKVIKENANTFMDFNAIAKGYGVDVISEFLESQKISNYIIEIGGEIRTKGINIEKDKPWKVGVEMPHFDGSQSIISAISLKDEAMATSGTYRKFKLDDAGKRYSHIIDANTGYPSKTSLLSISVIASNCMMADGYATAFKTMGIEKVKAFLEKHKELKVFLIFENDKNEFETLGLNSFPEF
ncbi:FAD:protein FMN transferase [Gaetbulibacter aquiaggeris]|uniref:FAD:protein FMN transferase n=1 Tax=Gaetbulibacter aquiaggeris TaxID=1735373 RepID=A0ABW7MME5_9FLAO